MIKHNEHRFLLDCGEGTQRQILQSGLGFKRLNRVLLTHGHLDHILGLAGLFSTFTRWETIESIEIFGGPWALERVRKLLFGVRVVPTGKHAVISIVLNEIVPGVIIQEDDFTVTAFEVDHRGPDCFGYLFEEKPRRPFLAEKADLLGVPHGPERRDLVSGKIVTLPDGRTVHPDEVLGSEQLGTRFAHTGDLGDIEKILPIVQGVDVLVSEATYLESEADMALEFNHLTAKKAATVAKEASVGHLILTHVSRRYRERDIYEEATSVFPNTTVARDFDAFQVKRGECVKVDTERRDS
jgi:ribonuclease Z